MVSFSLVKKTKKLGAAVPPGPEDTKGVLNEPEHAPSAGSHNVPPISGDKLADKDTVRTADPGIVPAPITPAASNSTEVVARRGRWRRPDKKTNRSEPFTTRFTTEFIRRLHYLAKRDELLLCEVIEKGVELYDISTTAKSQS